MPSLLPVWIALGAIAAYEVLALIFGWFTWSQTVGLHMKGHMVRGVFIFTVVILLAGHVIFGWFNRHHHSQDKAPSKHELPCPDEK